MVIVELMLSCQQTLFPHLCPTDMTWLLSFPVPWNLGTLRSYFPSFSGFNSTSLAAAGGDAAGVHCCSHRIFCLSSSSSCSVTLVFPPLFLSAEPAWAIAPLALCHLHFLIFWFNPALLNLPLPCVLPNSYLNLYRFVPDSPSSHWH